MTLTEAREIIRLATMLAIEAPERKSKFSVSATVTWATMQELREALTAAGIDLKPMFKAMRDVKAQHRRRVQEQMTLHRNTGEPC